MIDLHIDKRALKASWPLIVLIFSSIFVYISALDQAFMRIEVQIASGNASFQVYWADSNQNFSENRSIRTTLSPRINHYQLDLPDLKKINRIRIDPLDRSSKIIIKEIVIEQPGYKPLRFQSIGELKKFEPKWHISDITYTKEGMRIISSGVDPQLELNGFSLVEDFQFKYRDHFIAILIGFILILLVLCFSCWLIRRNERNSWYLSTCSKWIFVIASICLLINFRYVCNEQEKFQTFILFTYLFFLSAPCLCICFRILLPNILAKFLFFWFLIIALFPYRFLYESQVVLCDYYLYPPPKTIWGLHGYWVLIFYGLLSALITSCWYVYQKKKYGRTISKKEILISIILLLVLLVQVLPRLNDHSPLMVNKGIQHQCEGKSRVEFFGHCVLGDVKHHTMINAMYKGVADKYDNFVMNRRSLTPFLYSLIEPYLDPYYAAIVINSVLLYMIMLASYRLVIHFSLNITIAMAFAILLSANKSIHVYTVEAAFYLSKTAFAFLIILCGYKLRVFSQNTSYKLKLLFCSILGCISLTYDPYIYVAFIFIWAVSFALDQIKINIYESGRIFLHGIIYGCAPLLTLFIFERILRYYGLEGWGDNIQSRTDIFEKIFLLPSYFVDNMGKIGRLADWSINKLIFRNPREMEYINLLGSFGVICFFVFIPRYIDKIKQKGLYAIYLATILVPLAAMLAASIPPLARYHYIYVTSGRTNDFLIVLVLAQSMGIYYISKTFCRYFSNRINPAYLNYGVVTIIYIYSYIHIVSAVLGWRE